MKTEAKRSLIAEIRELKSLIDGKRNQKEFVVREARIKSCDGCDFSYQLNAEGNALMITGVLPESIGNELFIPSEEMWVDGKTYPICIIGYDAFCYKDIRRVVIPNSVSEISINAFCYCLKLEEVVIPNSVETIGSGAFMYCANLANVTIPDSVAFIARYAFAYSGLISITIPTSVTTIGERAFYSCEKLKTAYIPDGLDISNAGVNESTNIIRY